MGAHIEV